LEVDSFLIGFQDFHRIYLRWSQENPSQGGKMEEGNTTASVQNYLDQLAIGHGRDETVRKLLSRTLLRLQVLCGNMLRQYGRLTQGPLNLCSDELLSHVAERLLKALRKTRPATPRQFFGLANQHIRWALNDLAEWLDRQPGTVPMADDAEQTGFSDDSYVSPQLRCILEALAELSSEELEVFDLIKIQGLTYAEAADMLGVASKTIQRRLNRALLTLGDRLSDLAPP
jgi:RNA polymerase sigma factor (sigma-70 family)